MMTSVLSTCWDVDLSGFEYPCGVRLGNLLVCTVHCSASFISWFLRASSLAARVSLQEG